MNFIRDLHNYSDILEVVYTKGDLEGTLQIEYDDVGMKTKLILTRFGGIFETLRFNEKSFLNYLLGFTPFWDYKPTNAIHADSPGVYTCDKILNLNTIDKIHLKCDVINGSVKNGIREPILYSFILNKPGGYKVFCEPETVHYKMVNQCLLNTITFYIENDIDEEFNFNGETLPFTLHMIKI